MAHNRKTVREASRLVVILREPVACQESLVVSLQNKILCQIDYQLNDYSCKAFCHVSLLRKSVKTCIQQRLHMVCSFTAMSPKPSPPGAVRVHHCAVPEETGIEDSQPFSPFTRGDRAGVDPWDQGGAHNMGRGGMDSSWSGRR